MLPVSGAEQLKTSEPMPLRPMTSLRKAYSKLERPGPMSRCLSDWGTFSLKWAILAAMSAGSHRFQSPAERAFACRYAHICIMSQAEGQAGKAGSKCIRNQQASRGRLNVARLCCNSSTCAARIAVAGATAWSRNLAYGVEQSGDLVSDFGSGNRSQMPHRRPQQVLWRTCRPQQAWHPAM